MNRIFGLGRRAATALTASALAAGALSGTAGAAPAAAAPAGAASTTAAGPALDRPVAYVRAGNVYLRQGARTRRLTSGGGHARPRWSPDGKRIAYLRGGLLWTMKADGSAKRRLTDRPAAGPAWSPDGRWIAFASLGCTGGPSVYRVPATAGAGAVEVLFPASCRDQEVPPVSAPPPAPGGDLAARLATDDAVAWSPDGTQIAFRGGDCENVYDACLSLGTVATGDARVLAAYGGGGQEFSGFAVVPAFRPDGARVAWTAHQRGHTPETSLPVHVVEHDLATDTQRRVGAAEDRELAYAGTGKALVAGRHRGRSYVLLLDLATGVRTALWAGSQPAVAP